MINNELGIPGVFVGAMALVMAFVHFWVGPFSPQLTLDTYVSEKAASSRQKTFDALKGYRVEKEYIKSNFDADKVTQITTVVLGALALVLAAWSFSNHASVRSTGSAAALEESAIEFQFIDMYAMALFVVIPIFAVLSSLGGGV